MTEPSIDKQGEHSFSNINMHAFGLMEANQSTWRKPTHTPSEKVNSTQKGVMANLRIEAETFLLWDDRAYHCATVSPKM